ncbi:hypothetical protein G6F57_017210 [Rhizopus arrhizus]|nr:hypothetical protein G6F57_017210 [Rhizopus arrhizus]
MHGQGVARQGGKFGQEGQLVLAASAVMQMKVAAGGFQRGGHGCHRCDADAARDQQHGLVARRRFMQREIVLRAFDRQYVAFGKPMHVAGSALAGFFQPHTQPVFHGLGELPGLGGQLHQRIAARVAQARHRHLQVRARPEGGQRAGVLARQAEGSDQRRLLPDFPDDQFECLHGGCLFLCSCQAASLSASWRSMGPHFSLASAVSRRARKVSAASGRPTSCAAAALRWRYLPPPRTCVSL